jgi:hypothetical protein
LEVRIVPLETGIWTTYYPVEFDSRGPERAYDVHYEVVGKYVAGLFVGCHGVRLRLRDCHCQWQGQLPLPGTVAMALPGAVAMALPVAVAAPPFPQVV